MLIYNKNLAVSPITTHVPLGKVSKLILRIINKNNPKIHYVVGKPLQKFSIILKKVLPDLVFEKILNKFNKL